MSTDDNLVHRVAKVIFEQDDHTTLWDAESTAEAVMGKVVAAELAARDARITALSGALRRMAGRCARLRKLFTDAAMALDRAHQGDRSDGAIPGSSTGTRREEG